jgi:H+/Cl- antiporter ClcA
MNDPDKPRWWPDAVMPRVLSLESRLYIRSAVRWLVLGALVGILSGAAAAIFLTLLALATGTRLNAGWLLFGLPLAGFVIGWIYHRFGGASSRGNNLVLEELHATTQRIPLRMAFLVLGGTVGGHLFGASVGREGTAVQMGASLADAVHRLFQLTDSDRRMMLMAGISGGFGAVFGTPVAGAVFGMEVQTAGRLRYDALLPCLSASIVGDLVARGLGAAHAHYPALPAAPPDALLLAKVMLAGIVFGLVARLFIGLTYAVRGLVRRRIVYPPLRPVLGGCIVIALTLALGTQDFLGIGTWLIHDAVEGSGVAPWAFAAKLVFTAVCLGTGFVGGEVTPLFVMGSTVGYTMGQMLGVEPSFMASIGFVALFAAASNTPLACVLMGAELFGGGALGAVVTACASAYLASGHRSIYEAQRRAGSKSGHPAVLNDEPSSDGRTRDLH